MSYIPGPKLGQMLLKRTLPQVIVCLASCGIVVGIEATGRSIRLPATLLTGTFGLVLGFALTYLLSTSASVFTSGSQNWARMRSVIDNFARMIWLHDGAKIHIATAQYAADDTSPAAVTAREAALELTERKRALISLMRAYAVSVKHVLRGEPRADHEDLYPLIQHLPHYFWKRVGYNVDDVERGLPALSDSLPRPSITSTSAASSATAVGHTPAAFRMLSSCTPQASCKLKESTPLIRRAIKRLVDFCVRVPISLCRTFVIGPRRIAPAPCVIPGMLAIIIDAELGRLITAQQITTGWDGVAPSYVGDLKATTSDLLRLQTVPLAAGCRAFLRIVTWLYLLLFPFTMLENCGHWILLAVAFLAFVSIGMLDLSGELEHPFGFDPNDLDLDTICSDIDGDIDLITSCPPGMTYLWELKTIVA